MQQEKQFSPEESIALIESMIREVKQSAVENGFLYLLWGWTILFCALIQYSVLKFKLTAIKHIEAIWFIILPVTIYQVIYLIKENKQKRVKTYVDDMIANVWTTFGICMFVASFIISKQNIWATAYPFVLMLYGVPTYLSGFAMKFTPLKIGAFGCWILALVAVYVEPVDYLLIIAVAMTIAWIIPGYLLRAKFKREYNA
ncbi:MAG: hypothetical protein J0I09_09050 [Sphingobacteriia bacterium]|nr:hypothetical protein [Sphingobacteriia bacterium]